MFKKVITLIQIILIIMVISLIYFIGRETYDLKKPIEPYYKKLGLIVNGIGNGHITQAITVYKILKKKYQIPIVVIWGRDEGCDNLFPDSYVAYHKMFSNRETINSMNKSKVLKDFWFNSLPSYHYENIYGVNMWWNFFVPDLFNFRTTQINVSSQIAMEDWKIDILQKISAYLTYSIPVSINFKNKYSNYYLPPLICEKKIEREIDDKLVLCYSVSGEDFYKELKKIADKYIDFKFKYFTNLEFKNSNKNIEIFLPDKENFKNYLKQCVCVLCTSGNELILECVYNNIPVGTMACSNMHFEQKYNEDLYIKKLDYADSMLDIDLNKLINKVRIEKSLELEKDLLLRDEKVYELCKI